MAKSIWTPTSCVFVVRSWLSWLRKGFLVQIKGNLNATTYNDILSYHLLQTLSHFLLQNDTKQGPWRHGFPSLVWKNVTGLHRALTSTPHLWDEVELCQFLSPPTLVPDLTTLGCPLDEATSCSSCRIAPSCFKCPLKSTLEASHGPFFSRNISNIV